MRKILIIALLLLPTAMLTNEASAQTGMNAYVGPHLGIFKSQDADDASYLVGGTLRLKLIPSLTAEGMISYRQEEFAEEAVTVRTWPVTVTGLIHPLPIVYAGLGAGWYNVTIDYDDSINDTGIEDETSQEFGWHVAVGAELPLSEKLRVTGDIRYVFLDYDFADVPEAVLEGTDADFYSINIGLLFAL
jgi:outer membrane protein W